MSGSTACSILSFCFHKKKKCLDSHIPYNPIQLSANSSGLQCNNLRENIDCL